MFNQLLEKVFERSTFTLLFSAYVICIAQIAGVA
jgi:hypothetical protein